MKSINSNGEPLSPVAIITGIVSALIALLVSFGLDLTPEQIGAIVSFVSLVAPVVVWLVGRNKTVPVDNVVALVNKQGDTVAANASSEANGTPVVVIEDQAA